VSEPLPASAFDEEALLAGVRRWVEIESPTTSRDGVNAMMDVAARDLAALGAVITRHPGQNGLGDTVEARLPWGGSEPGILIVAHLDTVHEEGTLASVLPFRRDGDRAYGPGVYDMKGGAYCAVDAVRAVIEADRRTPLPITVLFVPDEEIGSPSSRAVIEDAARRNRFVLVPEPAQNGGDLITGRWAFQRFTVRTRGRPAHAGATSERGRSAIREMAEQVIRIEALSDPSRSVKVSVGVIRGGSFVNVVPADCEAEVLAVTPTDDDFDQVRARILALEPENEGIGLVVEAGPIRPLFEPTAATLDLYATAVAIARQIGFNPGHGTVGGGSDGNFTGALGIPTLDGLGVCGDGFHTGDEYALVSSLVPRARLFSGLLRTLR
jgi:glutamate carboxypeptidase